MILRLTSAFAAIMVSTLLAACGGGGASDPDTPIDLKQAWANYFDITGSQNFAVSGTIYGVSVIGSGVETRSPNFASSFEGAAAFEKIYDMTGTFTFTYQGQTFTEPLDDTYTDYFDASYALLGRVNSQSYMVVTGWFQLPVDALPGDSGVLFTADVWDSAARNVSYGSVTYTYQVFADSTTSVLVKLSSDANDTTTYRVTTTGVVTYVSEKYEDADGSLIFTYQ